jgi:predicted phosphodiesterase
MKRFLDNVFFPYLKEHRIQNVVHLGDLVDRRKYVNIVTAKRLREDFLEPLALLVPNVYFIMGNHDTYFKDTNSVNSMNELLGDRFSVIENDALLLGAKGIDILVVPWICTENRESIMTTIAETEAPVCFGHFEISGFEMNRGTVVNHGLDASIFDRFDVVCSGHFHHRSTNGSIFYLGSPCEFTWADYDDPKGFHVFDTETRELEFIRNPDRMFHKIFYDDLAAVPTTVDDTYRGKIVKVVVISKTDTARFDAFMNELDEVGPLSVEVVEDHANLDVEVDDEILAQTDSTFSLISDYVDKKGPEVDKDRVKKILTELYAEASTL